MAKERATFLGPRLRRIRRELGLTQAAMAEDLEVSASYIALMERNQRPVTADLLLRLASTYQLDLAALANDKSDAHAARLEAAIRDPLFSDLDVPPMDIEDVSKSYPGMAEAIIRLYTAYQEGQMALADRSSDKLAAADPVAEARRFLSARRNSFPAIDDKAERVAKIISDEGGSENYLQNQHGIRVRLFSADLMANSIRRFDIHRRELLLEDTLDRASRKFQIALQIAYLEFTSLIESAVAEGGFVSNNGERLARRALANYAASALMMPYRAFVQAAETRQYDIEALCRQFGASFEQVAHRLTTLQKPGQEGIPFFFIRVDAAGNVSKRLDGAGFPFARHGGSCPLLSLHQAFRMPRKIVTQWGELPDGDRFFSIARTVTAGGGWHGATTVERVVALGCADTHAHRLIYARELDLKKGTPDAVGVTCKLCHRMECQARAEPPLGRQILRDDNLRGAAPFGFDDA